MTKPHLLIVEALYWLDICGQIFYCPIWWMKWRPTRWCLLTFIPFWNWKMLCHIIGCNLTFSYTKHMWCCWLRWFSTVVTPRPTFSFCCIPTTYFCETWRTTKNKERVLFKDSMYSLSSLSQNNGLLLLGCCFFLFFFFLGKKCNQTQQIQKFYFRGRIELSKDVEAIFWGRKIWHYLKQGCPTFSWSKSYFSSSQPLDSFLHVNAYTHAHAHSCQDEQQPYGPEHERNWGRKKN